MRLYIFESEAILNRPVAEIFDFFSSAGNLEVVTPPWLNFRILTPPPIKMQAGTRIDYRLRLYGIPISWKTEITVWEPPHRFVDTQLKGPYRKWVHEHRFEETGQGTRMTDRVEYAVPGLIFAPLIHKFFVGRDVERIFAYRRVRLDEIFG
ncbi:MAG: SRPBCC family protein [Calditrichia bacterium]